LTRKAKSGETDTYRDGVISVLDTEHDLSFVDKTARQASAEITDRSTAHRLESLVRNTPRITLKELAAATGLKYWVCRNILAERGWIKASGRSKKGEEHTWQKTERSAIQSEEESIESGDSIVGGRAEGGNDRSIIN
jgi:hypothetical protein